MGRLREGGGWWGPHKYLFVAPSALYVLWDGKKMFVKSLRKDYLWVFFGLLKTWKTLFKNADEHDLFLETNFFLKKALVFLQLLRVIVSVFAKTTFTNGSFIVSGFWSWRGVVLVGASLTIKFMNKKTRTVFARMFGETIGPVSYQIKTENIFCGGQCRFCRQSDPLDRSEPLCLHKTFFSYKCWSSRNP